MKQWEFESVKEGYSFPWKGELLRFERRVFRTCDRDLAEAMIARSKRAIASGLEPPFVQVEIAVETPRPKVLREKFADIPGVKNRPECRIRNRI